jgi:hypothetical protein
VAPSWDDSSADLTSATVSNTVLDGTEYDEETVFPCRDTYDTTPWELDGGITPGTGPFGPSDK